MDYELTLRYLDPKTEPELFQEAYNWRSKRGKAEAGQMPYRDFLDSWAVMGLFNGEFIGVYVIKEFQPGCFDMHFNSKRQTPRNYLVAGGIQITNWLVGNGAREVSAVIIARNRALREFLEDCGYAAVQKMRFVDSPHLWLKYVAMR